MVELLQQLIRNACVNEGTDDSGHEAANAAVLRSLLEGPGCDLESYEPLPGRVSLVARIEGSDPGAPSLCYLGHTDVVPVNAADTGAVTLSAVSSSRARFGAGALSTC